MFLIKLLWLPVTIALSLASLVMRIALGVFSFMFGHLIFLAILIGAVVLFLR